MCCPKKYSNNTLRFLSSLDSPELFDRVGYSDVMSDDVKKASEGRDRNKVDKANGDLRDDRTENTRSYVINCDCFQTPEN